MTAHPYLVRRKCRVQPGLFFEFPDSEVPCGWLEQRKRICYKRNKGIIILYLTVSAATVVFLARFLLTAFIEENIFQLRRRRTQKGIIPIMNSGLYGIQTRSLCSGITKQERLPLKKLGMIQFGDSQDIAFLSA